MSFIIDSFQNRIQAFIWPATIVQMGQPWGAIGLGVAFIPSPRYVKKHIEAWMFSDVEEQLVDEQQENK